MTRYVEYASPTIFAHTGDLSCRCGYIIEVSDGVHLQKGHIHCDLCGRKLQVKRSLALKYNNMFKS